MGTISCKIFYVLCYDPPPLPLANNPRRPGMRRLQEWKCVSAVNMCDRNIFTRCAGVYFYAMSNDSKQSLTNTHYYNPTLHKPKNPIPPCTTARDEWNDKLNMFLLWQSVGLLYCVERSRLTLMRYAGSKKAKCLRHRKWDGQLSQTQCWVF